jgi:hypothetical protein
VWDAPNACGPVGAALSFGLGWTFGRLAAFGLPLLAMLWAVNRVRNAPAQALAVTSGVGTLLVFELCVLAGLGGLDRWVWSGAWGTATAIALHSALGAVGSWVVAGALFGITLLAATELGFHWIERFLRAVLVTPVRSMLAAWAARRAQPQPSRSPQGDRAGREDRRRREGRPPRRAARDDEDDAPAAPAPRPRISTAGTPVAAEHETDDGKQFRLPLPGLRKEERVEKPKKARSPRPRTACPSARSHRRPPRSRARRAADRAAAAAPPAQHADPARGPDHRRRPHERGEPARREARGLRHRWPRHRDPPGPVVTTFEFEPAAGVKVNQIVSGKMTSP